MCYYVCVIMHVKDPLLSVLRVGHYVPLASFCLSLYDLHALNRDVNMIQTNKQTNKQNYIHVGVSDVGYMCYIVTTLVKGLISIFLFLTASNLIICCNYTVKGAGK